MTSPISQGRVKTPLGSGPGASGDPALKARFERRQLGAHTSEGPLVLAPHARPPPHAQTRSGQGESYGKGRRIGREHRVGRHALRNLAKERPTPQLRRDLRRERIEEHGVEVAELDALDRLARISELEAQLQGRIETSRDATLDTLHKGPSVRRPIGESTRRSEHTGVHLETHSLQRHPRAFHGRERRGEVQSQAGADVEQAHDGSLTRELAQTARQRIAQPRLLPRAARRVAGLREVLSAQRPRTIVGANRRPHERYDATRLDPQEAQREKLASYGDAELARDYDQRWSGLRGPGRDRRQHRAILAALDSLAPVRSVLDVPCGTGRFTGLFASRGLSYIGMDASLAMLGEARRKHPNARVTQADLARLPLPDKSVDLVLCIRLMHLLRDEALRTAFLREMARVARIGIIVDFRHSRSLRVAIGRLRYRVGLRSKAPSAQSLEQLRALLSDTGLETTRVVHVRSIPWLTDKVVFAARPKD